MSEAGAILEAALARVAELDVDPAADFWARFFAASPEAEAAMAHMDEHMRGRMLASVFDLLMIEDEAERRAFLAFEIGNHDAYGARLPMYEALFDALRTAIREASGDAWDAVAERSWTRRTEALLALVSEFTSR